jgi:thiamine pyrophosphate-dependent acetolactate synthase large subunit-like protein
MKRSKQKVWCFIGDGAVDEGWFMEALRYAECRKLPIKYVVEDNNRSVVANVKQRWGEGMPTLNPTDRVIYYKYTCGYPHVGIGKWVSF